MPAPWENDAIVGQQPSQPTQPAQPAQGRTYPGVIQGAPAPVDPVKEVKDRQDITKGDLDIRARELDIRAKEADLAATEMEQKLGKEAGFYLRSLYSNNAINALGLGAESQTRALASGVLPDGWLNALTPSDRQQLETLQDDFIMAILRPESGAVIGPEEMAGYRRTYFPQAGDSAERIKTKAALRANMVQQNRFLAGEDAVKEVDTYLEGISQNTAPQQEEADGSQPFRGDYMTAGADGTAPEGQALLGFGTRNGEEFPVFGEPGSDSSGLRQPTEAERNKFDPKWRARGLADRTEDALGEAGYQDLSRQGATLGLSDEAAGVGQALSGVLSGDFNLGENYRLGRDAEQIMLDRARNRTGGAGTAVEVVSGGASILGKGGQVMSAGRSAVAKGNSIARSNPQRANVVQREMALQAGRDGATAGFVGGFGYGEGLEGSTVNALGGAAFGGVLGYGAQRVGNAAANRGGRSEYDPARAAEIARAGQAENVTVNRAMIDPRQENTFSGVEATRIGGPRINREMNRIEGQLEDGVERLGRGGQALDRTATGDRVQRAGERVISDTREVTNRKYQAAERMAGDTKIQPVRARTAAQTMIRDLSETANTNSAEIAFLKGLVEDFKKPLSISALRDLRTSLRKKISGGDLVFGQNEARVLQIMDEAAQDISEGLRQAGKANAASAFDAADTAYAARMDLIESTVQKLIGKRGQNLSAEQVASKLESMAKNDAEGLRKFWSQLDPTERADMQATFANALGRDAKGNFGPHIFLNNIGGKSRTMSDRAIRIVFGKDGAESVKNLKTLAEEVNRLNAMRNRSNTARANNYSDWLLNALGFVTGGGAGMMGGSATALAGAAAGTGAAMGTRAGKTVLDAKMLMSPKIQKWLIQAPRTQNPAAIDRHFNRLGDIAKAEPALAGEIEWLRKTILGAANDNAAAGANLAAEDQDAQER